MRSILIKIGIVWIKVIETLKIPMIKPSSFNKKENYFSRAANPPH